MIAIIDNDVIFKMARWNLLAELTTLLGGDPRKIRHLSTCVHALCGTQSRMRRTGCDEASAGRIRAFCAASSPLSDAVDPVLLDELAAIDAIDAGEVQIFATASGDPDAITYMGDKRSLLALAGARSLERVTALLAGRVKCLEQVIGELILQESAQAIGAKVLACTPQADIAVTISFKSHHGMRPELEIWEALRSYYGDLKANTGALLAPFPVVPAAI